MIEQHTPGPWHKEYDCGAYNIEAPAPGEPGKTFLVACAVSDRDLPIILNAPELLAAAREAAAALDALLQQKPMLAATVCGSTTLGNHRAQLHAAINKAAGA